MQTNGFIVLDGMRLPARPPRKIGDLAGNMSKDKKIERLEDENCRLRNLMFGIIGGILLAASFFTIVFIYRHGGF